MTDETPVVKRRRIDPYSREALAKLSQAKHNQLLRHLGAIDPHSLMKAEINPDDPSPHPTKGIEASTPDEFMLSIRARFSSRLLHNPPKYQHPKRPYLAWRGTGTMPRWLREAIDNGADLEDFLTRKG